MVEWCVVRNLAQIGHFALTSVILSASSLTSMILKKLNILDQALFDNGRIIDEAIREIETTSEEISQQV